jgi:hypothetical protein
MQQTPNDGLAKLGQNLAMVVFQFLLVCFFLNSTNNAHRISRQGVICAMTVALLSAFWLITPSQFRCPPDTAIFSPNFDVLSMRLFQLTGDVYACYVIPIAFRASWRFASLSRQPLSLGLRIIAVALCGKCIGATERTTSIVAEWINHPLPARIDIIVGLILWASQVEFLMGVVYPSVAGRALAVRQWHDHRRTYRRLEPLWSILHQAYPQTTLHRVPQNKMRHLLFRQSMHRRYYRRAIECRDGLVYISPYLPRPPQGAAAYGASQWALELRAALTASANQYPPCGGALLIAGPAGPDLDSDVTELVALSQALVQLDKCLENRSN